MARAVVLVGPWWVAVVIAMACRLACAAGPPEAPEAVAGPGEPRMPWLGMHEAGEGVSLSLAQAVSLALRDNRGVRSSELDQDLQRLERMLAEAEFQPRLALSGQTDRSWPRPAGGGPWSTQVDAQAGWKLPTGSQLVLAAGRTGAASPAFSASLQLVQPLLKGHAGVAGLPLRGARLSEAVGRLLHRHLVGDTVSAVVQAYLDAVQAEAQAELSVQGLQRSQATLGVHQALFEAGRLARRDLMQAELDIAQNELSLAQARHAAEQAKRGLLQLLGPTGAQLAPQSLKLVDPLAAMPAPALVDEDTALRQAVVQREELRVAELALELARIGLLQAVNDGLPQLDAVASVAPPSVGGPSNGQPGDPQRAGTAYALGLRFNVTLDDTLRRAQSGRAQAALTKAQWALDDLRLEVRNQVADAVRELQFAEKQRALAARSLDLTQKNLDSELERLKAGRTSAYQVSAVQDDLKQAQAAMSRATLAMPRAWLRLHKATGQVLSTWAPEGAWKPLPP